MKKQESKHDCFVRIAEARTNKRLNMIRLIGNLAVYNNYEYSKEEIDQIFTVIEEALLVAKKKFEEKSDENKIFKLKE